MMRATKRLSLQAAALVLAVAAAACNDTSSPPSNEPVRVLITSIDAPLPVGGTMQVTAYVFDRSGNKVTAPTTIYWSSLNSGVVSVTPFTANAGDPVTLKGITYGSTSIVASSGVLVPDTAAVQVK